MNEMRDYHGRCHCGAVRFTARTDLSSLGDCNCSRCRRLGWVMQSVPAADFTLNSGEDQLALYHFNTEKIDHLFCKTCGIQSFARGSDGQGNELVMVNVNCFDPPPSIDRSTITHWEGAKF